MLKSVLKCFSSRSVNIKQCKIPLNALMLQVYVGEELVRIVISVSYGIRYIEKSCFSTNLMIVISRKSILLSCSNSIVNLILGWTVLAKLKFLFNCA